MTADYKITTQQPVRNDALDIRGGSNNFINLFMSLDRPSRFQGVETPRFQDNRHMEVVKLSALRTVRLYHQGIFLVLVSVRRWVRPVELSQWRIPMIPLAIKLASFQLVTQWLNQMRHRVPSL